MLVAFEKGILYPIMVNIVNWFEEWPAIHGGSGGITPETIPDGVLWADLSNVIIADESGNYIQVVGG